MNFDYVVIGNGLLGAAITERLSQMNSKVACIGPEYGYRSTHYSSHQDDSRLVRLTGYDAYWDDLTLKNIPFLHELECKSGHHILKKNGVMTAVETSSCIESHVINNTLYDNILNHISPSFQVLIDPFGGMLNPLTYIQALNQVSTVQGATLIKDAISAVKEYQGHYRLYLERGFHLTAQKVIDARGVFVPQAHEASTVTGKILMFVQETSKTEIKPELPFYFSLHQNKNFDELYGFYQYTNKNGHRQSKFGFGENKPVTLPNKQAVIDWYRGEYKNYPYMKHAKHLVRSILPAGREIEVRPCTFSKTSNRKIHVSRKHNYSTIFGCNGMAAKCPQAIADKYLDQII